MNSIQRFSREDRGSASVEFVALAIPLFIPLFIYINSFASMSDGQDSLRTLAREATRGFVTSSNDEIAFGVAHEILTKGAILLGYQTALQRGEIVMDIDCSSRPCISPNARIRITLTQTEQNQEKIRVSAIEYVSPWA
jgi:Flp pilus assembly protein TadG